MKKKGLSGFVLVYFATNLLIACPFDRQPLRSIGGRALQLHGWVEFDQAGTAYIGGKPVVDQNIAFRKSQTFPIYNGMPQEGPGGITKAEYDKVIREVTAPYFEFAAKPGRDGRLVVESYWNLDVVNAFANREENLRIIYMYGGLARRPEITSDGFAFVVCHELGHHFAGFPYYEGNGNAWAAAEGQSDYFAVNGCLKKYFTSNAEQQQKNRDAIANLNRLSPGSRAVVEAKCRFISHSQDTSASLQKYGLCIRESLASKSVADLLANLVNDPLPEFNTPDPTIVTATQTWHPPAQCRLDTGFSGTLCTVNSKKQFDYSAIPGEDFQEYLLKHPQALLKLSESYQEEREGYFFSCGRNSNDAAVSYLHYLFHWQVPDLGEPWGYRPSCWYRELKTFGPYIF